MPAPLQSWFRFLPTPVLHRVSHRDPRGAHGCCSESSAFLKFRNAMLDCDFGLQAWNAMLERILECKLAISECIFAMQCWKCKFII